MRCKFFDSFGVRLHEGDVVEVTYPDCKIKVKGIVEYSREMSFWGARVTHYYYPSVGRFVPRNTSAAVTHVSLAAHKRKLSKRLRGVRLLQCADESLLPLRPGIDFETPVPYAW